MPTSRLMLAVVLFVATGNGLSHTLEGLVPYEPPRSPSQKDLVGFGQTTYLKDPKSQWLYTVNKDVMRDKTRVTARLSAFTPADRPHSVADVTVVLSLNSAPNGSDIVRFDRTVGKEIGCKGRCQLEMRFDSGPVIKVAVQERGQAPLNSFHIVEPKAFVKSLKKSKVMIVEFPLVGAMPNQLVFETAGLKWD
ncbi:hypothetical protein [Cupriavidus taiwanensis]|uniref:Uncharacterized protein n=1 Tax=Cupriavidus taiwanensis (strain DSM 17343 / BCRC 17206 / CCUG 44338 / CIP 107171 / LMG 19424 / R1) TaxID=977880 RepID=B3R9M9_CUPTR|nr:hypothetical protein [Cupriavidus taiwanensis]CAQ71604.1 hypothetical protein; putative exported protein [Cupriavidus taiwanensis LMG 19424]